MPAPRHEPPDAPDWHERCLGWGVAARLVARGLMLRRARRTTGQRLAGFPATAPLSAPLRIRWSAQQIPFVEAECRRDLAVGVGLVHAHLRLAQLSLMRHAALGRLSELIGPLGIELDRSLRLLELDRAVPAMIETMQPDLRLWLDGFLLGLNCGLDSTQHLPEEMRLLGLGREPWTLAHLLTTARLAAADVNWMVFGRLLRARASMDETRWRALWPRLLGGDARPNPPDALAATLARVGSNAAAVAGHRTAQGGALFAADPHLSVALPNVWLAIGLSAPDLNACGLMPAGLPVIAIGRNRDIAWGGTSLHASASDLVDVAGETLEERLVGLRVRGLRRERLVRLRRSAQGPVVSDGRMLHHPSPLALRWVGHHPSDEFGAMLAVMQARDGDEFARALAGFAIPGQNMLHAGADGSIGHLLALASPRRPDAPPADLLVSPDEADARWQSLLRTSDFPHRRDPAAGVFASANDPPPPSPTPPGFFYSPPDRALRLRALLEGTRRLTLDDLAATQSDVQGRLETVQALVARLPPHPVRDRLAAWDGRYDRRSAGAVLFEALIAELGRSLPDQARLRPLAAVWTGRRLLADAILALDDDALRPLARAAMNRAGRLLRRHRSWGRLHRMAIRHHFAAVPLLGLRYRFGAYPSPGGNDTLNKTGHAPVLGPHRVTYGASARFLTDLSEPDSSRVVLLGGQDGWIGSDNFADQVAAWRRGDTFDLPLRPETARRWPHLTVVHPA